MISFFKSRPCNDLQVISLSGRNDLPLSPIRIRWACWCLCELLTSLPDLHSQPGQLALQHRLLLLGHIDLLRRLDLLLLLRLGGLLALQRLDLQGDAVLRLGWGRGVVRWRLGGKKEEEEGFQGPMVERWEG